MLNPPGLPESVDYDDSSWSEITLPHTWNGDDAASTRPRGSDGWYRKRMTGDRSATGKRLFLKIGAGSITTSLFIDGREIKWNGAAAGGGSHKGAFQAFAFDVTEALNAPLPAGHFDHLVAVHTSSANNIDVAPANGGDYSRQGGLYRDVSLLAVNPLHIAITESVPHSGVQDDIPSPISDSGIEFSHSPVVMGAESTVIHVKVVLDNLDQTRSVMVNSYLVDSGGIVRAQMSGGQPLEASQTGAAVLESASMDHPHLWNGRVDPYLYDLYVEVRDRGTGELLDSGHEKVGIRSFKINANPNPDDPDPMNRAAFMLNGRPYRLFGVDLHQDSGRLNRGGHPAGWAQTAAQIRADLDMVADMGATAIRTSHYQDSPAFYGGCDELGIMVYTESPINGGAASSSSFLVNAEDQYNELIRQNYNHPSIFAWGFGNETGQSAALTSVFTQFSRIAHALDPSRLTGLAQYGGSPSSSSNTDGISDIKGTHPYDYWYGPSDVKATHNAYPAQPLGVTEYGGGASAYQYADQFTLPVSRERGGVRTHFHPANQQTRLEELQFTDLRRLPFLWGMFTWQMFDHGSSGKDEGDEGGVNDKGLATRDRVPKDSYYFYQASLNDPSRSWNNKRVLAISDRFWTVRNQSAATVTVFSNVGTPTLTLNGRPLGQMTPFSSVSGPNSPLPGSTETVADTYTMDVSLIVGENHLQVRPPGRDDPLEETTAVWTYRDRPAGTPFAKVDFVGPGQPTAPGYSADQGEPFTVHGNQTYGWLAASGSSTAAGAVLPVGRALGSAVTDASRTGIYLNYDPVYKSSSVWQYALPDGTYDVRIIAAHEKIGDGVNMFALQGKTAAIGSSRDASSDTFLSRLNVADGKLTLAAAPGAYHTCISSIDINRVGDATTSPTVETLHP